MANWSAEETDNPPLADHRNFYKVEEWSRDGQRVERIVRGGKPCGLTSAGSHGSGSRVMCGTTSLPLKW